MDDVVELADVLESVVERLDEHMDLHHVRSF
jgi:hypothetical protein